MKKIACIIAVFVLSINTLLAEEGKISFGLEVSPAITWLNTNHTQINSNGSDFKLDGGLLVNINLGKTYSIVTGLRYNTFGGKLKGKDGLYEETVKYEFKELELPIGLKLRTGSFGKLRFAAHLTSGIGVEIQPKASKQGLYEDKKSTEYKFMPIRGLYNLGIGAEYELNEIILTATISYKGWLSNLYYYKGQINYPATQLDVVSTDIDIIHNPPYATTISFQPSAVVFSIGVIF